RAVMSAPPPSHAMTQHGHTHQNGTRSQAGQDQRWRPNDLERCPIPTLRPGEGMEALEIERQTDQAPLARRRRDPTQGELAEAQHLFDDADYRFDRAFAYPIDRFA